MDITVVAVSAIVVGSGMLLGAFSAWLRYLTARRARADRAGVEQLTGEIRALRVTLDAVAIEVERLGEGQRFATQLLRERSDSSAAKAPAPRVVTPH